MKTTLAGAVAVGALVALVAPACGTKERDFNAGNGDDEQSTAGASGAAPDGSGGNEASAGTRGDVLAGGSPAEAGAGGATGGAESACERNDCTSCLGAMPAPGTSCGECGTNVCNADQTTTSCLDPKRNACGGCAELAAAPGADCGACSVTACTSDKNSLDCVSQCTEAEVCVSGLNQCKTPDCSAANSCGRSDGAGGICTNTKGQCPAMPNATGSCSGSSCAYACNDKTLSCSTSAEPACGSWNFESNSPGFEGWQLKNTSNAASGGLYYATPPGAAAGAKSLALNVDGTAADALYITISVDVCPGGALATGIQGAFHAQVWFKPSDGKGALGGPGYTYINDGNDGVVSGPDVNCPAGEWFDVPSHSVAGTSIKQIELSIAGINGHKGTLYFDNMYFE